ncbi:AMIN domain-containing protein [Candidatus Aminicenantes bacterium AC-335-A11]|nr:AMIN domain-containing protein [SCandidatus Aminicenantes bacterium Aminicenantia_JdfR_composite]MCP2596569.1 AMIN domain-containing protein [Candidatus Aminicenantes bacterium AC-335-G13]MCP2598652.1 AMIN domain-containing protein [Candidatus Aminicenantes bacterium AC-335-L06]MCP2618683.1 AMIN domain-containing protein [Candidatus Aminicenantes bacterium AC-335-A11]
MRNLVKTSRFLIVFIFLFGCIFLYGEEPLNTLKNISCQIVNGKIEVIVELEGKFEYDVFELYVPPRLVIDIWKIQNIAVKPEIKVAETGVLKIRVGEYQPEVARVVFDLQEPIPSYNVERIKNGIKVTFLLRKIPKKVKEIKPVEVKKVELPPKKIEKKKVVREIPKRKIERNYFIQIRGGLSLFLKPELTSRKDFVIYGEDGFINENYKFKTSLILFDVSGGTYFNLFQKTIKTGLGFTLWSIGNDASFILSIPHPFISDSPREVNFDDKFKNNFYNFYVYGLYPIFERDNFKIWTGLILGYANGKMTTLEDLSFEEKAPFTSSDITITSKSYVEDKISNLWGGFKVNFEYLINKNFSLIMDTRLIYMNPKVTNLGKRANYLQWQTHIGIQYSF